MEKNCSSDPSLFRHFALQAARSMRDQGCDEEHIGRVVNVVYPPCMSAAEIDDPLKIPAESL